MSRTARLFTLTIFLLSHAFGAAAQEATAPNAPSRQRAAQEIESVLAATGSVTDRSALVRVRAKAANLLWLQDRTRASRMFEELWQWVERSLAASGDKIKTVSARAKRLN